MISILHIDKKYNIMHPYKEHFHLDGYYCSEKCTILTCKMSTVLEQDRKTLSTVLDWQNKNQVKSYGGMSAVTNKHHKFFKHDCIGTPQNAFTNSKLNE